MLAGEMKHGPLALVDENLPIIVIVTRDTCFSKQQSVIQQFHACKGQLTVICSKGDAPSVCPLGSFRVIEVPRAEDCLQPVVNIVPLQLLFQLHFARVKGTTAPTTTTTAATTTTTLTLCCSLRHRKQANQQMASSLPKTTTASASPVVAKRYPNLAVYKNPSPFSVSYPLSSQHKLPLFSVTQGLQPNRNYPTLLKAQVNEDTKDPKPSNEPWPSTFATEESISQFISQVSSLVKLVDSRDIVELQLKQLDCEVIIRKKEALPQPPSPAPVVMMSSPAPQHAIPPPPPAAPSSAPAFPLPTPSPPPAKSAKSSLPALKCPMAGTFYRSPAPGEPPFVKVGDKVQKGQVLCIIEAMKLMNEIEADQSGTIAEILVEDGKPVSVDMPLFVIEP